MPQLGCHGTVLPFHLSARLRMVRAVRTVSLPAIFITAMKTFEMNCGPWSDRIRPGGPYGDTHASLMADAMDMAVIRPQATHFVSLAKRSVITRRKRFPLLEAGMGPKMSTETSVSGSVAGIRVKGGVCRRKARRFCAHVVHLVMVFWMSVTIHGQYYDLRMTYYIRFIPGWAVTVAWCSRVKTRSRSDFGLTSWLPYGARRHTARSSFRKKAFAVPRSTRLAISTQ